MTNKSQLQENNITLDYILDKLRDMPNTEECMELIEELQKSKLDSKAIIPIEQGGTGATTASEALAKLGGVTLTDVENALLTPKENVNGKLIDDMYTIDITIEPNVYYVFRNAEVFNIKLSDVAYNWKYAKEFRFRIHATSPSGDNCTINISQLTDTNKLIGLENLPTEISGVVIEVSIVDGYAVYSIWEE